MDVARNGIRLDWGRACEKVRFVDFVASKAGTLTSSGGGDGNVGSGCRPLAAALLEKFSEGVENEDPRKIERHGGVRATCSAVAGELRDLFYVFLQHAARLHAVFTYFSSYTLSNPFQMPLDGYINFVKACNVAEEADGIRTRDLDTMFIATNFEEVRFLQLTGSLRAE